MQNVEVYKNENGEIAILISGGFGAGWSTWGWGDKELAYDRRVVEFYLAHKSQRFSDLSIEDRKRWQQQFDKFGYSCGDYFEYGLWFDGFDNLYIEWVKPGELFRISEYDGAESLETLECAGFMSLE